MQRLSKIPLPIRQTLGGSKRIRRTIYDVPVNLAVAQVTQTKVSEPPWLKTARAEIGVKEVAGAKANAKILNYFKASKFWGKDDSTGTNAWCGSFMAWVMKQHSYTPPSAAYRAKSWESFGKKITDPIIGAIGIKSRKGGGHVAFIVGKSKEGNTYYMLGGNQKDQVMISAYPKSVWTTFVVPDNFDTKGYSLPIYKGIAKKATSES